MGMQIELDGGKYTAIFEDNGQMKALRHGEPWRDITGDNLIYFLMCEVEKLRDAEIDRLKAERAVALAVTPAADAEVVAEKADPLDALRWGANVAETLLSIGRAIGFGRAQQILGEQWEAEHNCAPRGRMGVTVKDDAQSATPAAVPVVLPESLAKAIDRFDAYFRSANGVPPNARISVPTSEWQELRALLATGGQAQAVELEPFGYFKAEPFGWTDCGPGDEGAVALYEWPQAPAAPAAVAVPDETQIKSLMRKHRIWIEHSTLFEDDEPPRELRAVQAEQNQFEAFVQDLIALAATPAAAPLALPEPWGYLVEGRIFIGRLLPQHVISMVDAEGFEPTKLYTEPQMRALLATGGQAQSDARDAEIDRLNGDLAAIGAGGVESLRKPSTERPSYEFSSKNRDGTWTPWLPLGGGLKFENVKVRQQHTSNAQQRIPAAERPDSPCVALCTTLYDEYCRGCGRHYLEVARWGQMTDVEKGAVWARLEVGSEKCTPSKS